jgi:multidrug efflux system membrane fusion protein
MDPDRPGEPRPGSDEILPSAPASETRALDAQIEEPPVRERPDKAGKVKLLHRRRLRISRRQGLLLALAVAALGAASLYRFAAVRHERAATAAAAQQAPASITTGRSRSGDINVYVTALGTVTPIYTVTVYSQITGRVMEVHYREGQMVEKGDPLIDIDPRPYQALLEQSQGNLRHDKALLAQARIDLKRYQAAAARNAIPRQQLEDQQQAVYQYEGAVRADEGAVAYNRVQLEYCHIVAPISGRVGLRLVDPGNTVFAGASSTLVVITQLKPITIVFNVSEDDLPQVQAQLRSGGQLRVDAFDRADERHIEAGTLTSLDNQIDTTTGTLRLRAEFSNDELQLFPNQFVNARLLVRTLTGATLVPTAALQYNGTHVFVYAVKPDSTVAVQPVTALASNEPDTAVEGLSPGVSVAISGFDRLENGVAIRVRQAAAASSVGQGVQPRASHTFHPAGPGSSQSSSSVSRTGPP